MTKNAKNSIIRVRIDEHIKNQAEIILRDLGLTPQLAIELLYRQIITQRKIPFEIKLQEIYEKVNG